MKTKKEVIQEAWDSTFPDSSNYSFEKISSAIDANGWYRFNNELSINICVVGFDYDKGAYRTPLLRGIETNNGWIRIESEADLPRKENTLWIRYEDGSTILGRYNIFTNKFVTSYGKMFDEDKPTHFQYITQPLPPLF